MIWYRELKQGNFKVKKKKKENSRYLLNVSSTMKGTREGLLVSPLKRHFINNFAFESSSYILPYLLLFINKWK